MKTKDEILKELQEIAPKLALLEKTNPYKLPDGYFLNFKNVLIEKIKLGEAKFELKSIAPELSKLEISSANQIPEGYFSNFSTGLINKIRAQEALNELAEIAPQLSTLEKINAIEVPADYFSTFANKVLNAATRRSAPVPVTPQWIQSLNNTLDKVIGSFFKPKYSFAFAGFTTTVIIAVMMFMKVNQCNDLDCKFAQLSNEEINTYLDNKSDAYSDEIFEMNLDEKALPAAGKENTLNIYKDALKNVDDAALNEAIND
jgi:hypothetical protein